MHASPRFPDTMKRNPGATMSSMGSSLVVASSDFVDGGPLAVRHSANAWGQCAGDNLNPQLSWSGAPTGTVTYAITMLDRSAGNYVHWVHVNIPSNVTSVKTGGSATLAGVIGRSGEPSVGYFGPCPPGPNHRYEFIVWACDVALNVPATPTFVDFFTASADHVLAKGSITGVFSPAQ